MKKILSLLLLFIFCSCASAKANWVERSPDFSNQTWRICQEEYDGAEKALNGFCYISKECKSRFLRRPVCRALPKYIPYTDKAGVLKIINSGKVLHKRD